MNTHLVQSLLCARGTQDVYLEFRPHFALTKQQEEKPKIDDETQQQERKCVDLTRSDIKAMQGPFGPMYYSDVDNVIRLLDYCEIYWFLKTTEQKYIAAQHKECDGSQRSCIVNDSTITTNK